jgi:hypothetical protein
MYISEDESVISRLKNSLLEFVATEIIETLLDLKPNSSSEKLMRVHHNLLLAPNVIRIDKNFDFVNTSSLKRSPNEILSAFDLEIRLQTPGISKVGDILYAQSWQLVDCTVKDLENAVLPLVPCWLLLTLSNRSNRIQVHSKDSKDTSIELNVSILLRISHSHQNQSDSALISENLLSILDKCCFKINQKLLLRDLYETRIASPYLLAPVVAAGTPPPPATHSNTQII